MREGVQQKRLAELFAFKNGRSFKKEEWSNNGLPIIRIQNLNSEDAPFNYFSGEYSRDILVNPGDLLFSWSGTVGSSFGSHLWNGEAGLLNQHIFKIGLRDNIIKRYAFYGLRQITEEIERSVNGAVGLVHITKEKLNEFTLPLPPVTEQQRIVGILDRAFEGIVSAKANSEKNLQNARALFESYLQSVFAGSGRGWDHKQLRDFCSFENGDRGTNYPSKSARTITGIPFINAGHLSEDGIDLDAMNYISRERFNLLSNGKIRKGDILFCLRGSLGKFASVGELSEGAIASSLVIVRPEKTVLNEFLVAYFRSQICSDMINRFKNGAAQPNLSAQSLGKFIAPIPPLAEQQVIVEKLAGLRAETQRLESIYRQKLASLDALKKSLLHQAFTGNL